MKISNNSHNLSFEKLINKSKDYLEEKLYDTCGYSSRVLFDRLVQHVMEITIAPYGLEVDQLCNNGEVYYPALNTKINIGNAVIEVSTGHITITYKQWLVNQFNFIKHWLFCLFSIFSVDFSNNNKFPVTLLYGVGDESLFVEDNDKQFWNYCRLGPITPLRNGKSIYVESLRKPFVSKISQFRYCKYPLISFLRESKIGFFGRYRLLKKHLALLFKYLYSSFRIPLLSLLSKEFAYSGISFELDRLNLIESIILTNSGYTSQPLWIRALNNAKTHMIWYSQNMKTLDLNSENLKSNIPALRWMRLDVHWVWTQSFSNYLNSIGIYKSIKIVGPIVWYLPKITQPEINKLKIIIFDILPYSDQVALKHGQIFNYNHPKNMLSFIDGVISMKFKLEKEFDVPVSLFLKAKRGYNTSYDQSYFDYIDELDITGVITQVHHSTNMYHLISSSNLAIVYPFSSPAYIADFVRVPSIFYDPTHSISRYDFGDSDSLIKFENNPEELFNTTKLMLSRSIAAPI
jgi:hypothetical protein